MDIYEKRLTILRSLIGENQLKDFASAHTEVDASYISQILNGHRTLGDRAAINLARKINVPADLLTTGNYSDDDQKIISARWIGLGLKPPALPHPALFSGNINEIAQRNATQRDEVKAYRPAPVPVVGKAMLGTDGYFDALDYPPGHGDGYIDIVSTDPHAYGLKVVGSSMHPRIKSGEFVLIEPNHPYQAGDEVLVRTKDGRAMVKEFIYCRNGQFRFDSISDGYPPVFLDEDAVEHIHYVAAILKSSKYMDI
ncbi:helix-turn-helix transcriptional regulator [Pseudomonas syringae pv. dysoxyli]|uniref:XRE family transcriptional regulator n=1 Tax=Pseudomonas syringae TaxID=317 RepID=UPI0013737D18|nr:XRE family transcriptional regulator [Pseudomonas syringae]NAO25921.1 helix-turn-helix transcriptional regulator [Pseudomonas syringae pv. dysoxyli]